MTSACSILVVDDEPNLRRTLAAILQRAGYLVTTASSAADAIQNLASGRYDLVFLDIRMPEVDGMTLLTQIRRLFPEMPVLIMTAHATLETAMQAVRQGARDYLLKPMEPEKILTRVAEILNEQQLPVRRQQIFSQIQNLLGELNTIDKPESPQGATSGLPVSGPDPVRYLSCGLFTLDLHTRYVRFNDRQIPLPPSSFDFLVTLVRHSPNPVTYETLLMESQGYSLTRSEAREMARWQVHELRKAIEPDPRQPRFIITVRDVGYRLAT